MSQSPYLTFYRIVTDCTLLDWSWAIHKFHDYPFEQVQRKMVRSPAYTRGVLRTHEPRTLGGGPRAAILPAHLPRRVLEAGFQGRAQPGRPEACHGGHLCRWRGNREQPRARADRRALTAAGQTYSTITTFMLAMVLHPHVLDKAHEEIDRVVGPKRLPDFDDRENLPYIEGIFQEVLRYVPPVSAVVSANLARLRPHVSRIQVAPRRSPRLVSRPCLSEPGSQSRPSD